MRQSHGSAAKGATTAAAATSERDDVMPRAWLQIESMSDYPGSDSQTKDHQQRTR